MRTFRAQKAALTRALRAGDKAKIAAECLRTRAEWDVAGIWPDAWHRWNIAFLDATGAYLDER